MEDEENLSKSSQKIVKAKREAEAAAEEAAKGKVTVVPDETGKTLDGKGVSL